SGSTGRPKGVAASHAPLSHFIAWQAETFGLSADDRITMLSGLSHDPLLRDVFAPLSLGATLLIPDHGVILEPGALARWLRKTGATVAHLTPAVGQILAAEAAKARPLTALRQMFWGGDLLRPSLLGELAELTPNASHVNLYGCTETPQAAGFFRYDGDANWAAVPVGKGSAGYQLLVVDAQRRPVGIGEAGEIAVRSGFLSLGYVEGGRVVAPTDRGLDADGAANTYYTGDRGLYLPDGNVLMVGRDDDQVKIRGHRVELAEVTAALLARPLVRSAVALALGEGGHRRIVGFVAGPRRAAFDEEELRDSLAARLPAHMVPHAIRWVESLPLLPNGKVDRQALIEATEAETAPPSATARAPSPRERELMTRWSGILGVGDAITLDSTFANLGGDSLSYVQAFLATEEVVGETPDGWQLMTIAELAHSQKSAAKGWNGVDMPILLRAASIFLVVAGHLRLFSYGGGATTSLLLVSGVLFGGLQLPQAYAKRSAQPALRWLVKLLVPTMLFSVGLFTVKALAGKDPNISTLLLSADFQDYSKLSSPTWGGHEFYLWFIHCLLQILAIMGVSLALLSRFDRFRTPPLTFAWALFLAGCIGRFVAPIIFYPDFFRHGAPPFSTVDFLPTTHLGTFMLGVMIALAASRVEKAWVVAGLVGYAVLSAAAFDPQQAVIVLAGGLALLAARQLSLPKPVALVVFALSGGSLFIYLTHFMVRSALRLAHAPEWPALHVAAAIAVGVGVWWGWNRLAALAGRFTRQPALAEPQAAI
ncbi:MAG TPA: AMP-binding protein, partial [Phenylobacterium sp.]